MEKINGKQAGAADIPVHLEQPVPRSSLCTISYEDETSAKVSCRIAALGCPCFIYSLCQKFFPLIPSPPNEGRGLG
jgi:hypothetical protein